MFYRSETKDGSTIWVGVGHTEFNKLTWTLDFFAYPLSRDAASAAMFQLVW